MGISHRRPVDKVNAANGQAIGLEVQSFQLCERLHRNKRGTHVEW